MSVTEKWFPKRNPRAGGKIYIWTLGANKTAHVIAREFGHDEVLRLLMDRSPMELKLSLACELGDEETFSALLARKPDLVSSLSDDDRRKLVDAAQNSNADAVRLMLRAGWPLDARGQHGATALHFAAWHGNVEIVREILRHNPPIEDAANHFKATPLGWATHGSENSWHCKTGDYAGVAELLCAAGARVPEVISGTVVVREVLKRSQETGWQ
jgi:hypothetical protein